MHIYTFFSLQDGDTPLLNVLDLGLRLHTEQDAEVVSLLLENGANMEFLDKVSKM